MPTRGLSSSSPLRKARALYACKAEHDSELSFTAGTVFDNGECWGWGLFSGHSSGWWDCADLVGSTALPWLQTLPLSLRETLVSCACPGVYHTQNHSQRASAKGRLDSRYQHQKYSV